MGPHTQDGSSYSPAYGAPYAGAQLSRSGGWGPNRHISHLPAPRRLRPHPEAAAQTQGGTAAPRCGRSIPRGGGRPPVRGTAIRPHTLVDGRRAGAEAALHSHPRHSNTTHPHRQLTRTAQRTLHRLRQPVQCTLGRGQTRVSGPRVSRPADSSAARRNRICIR